MKKDFLIMICILISVIVIFPLLIYVLYFSKSLKNDLNDYIERRANNAISQQILPDITTFPQYSEIYYKYIHKNMFIFSSDTMLLVVTYDEATYQHEKEKLSKYNYLEKPSFYINQNTGENLYLLPENSFFINTYHFNVLEGNNENGFKYPKYIGMIATSDEKKSIAYLYFEDMDLDYICEGNAEGEMVKFVKEYFKYDW